MNGYFSSAAVFLIDAVFGIYMIIVLLRLMLQILRADFYNPLSQFIVKVTNPLLKPLRRIIPGVGGIDFASIVLLFILQLLKLILTALAAGAMFSITSLFVLSIAELIALVLNVYMISILIQIVLSWIGPNTYNPVTGILYAINEPVMRPARRILPPIANVDLSPILVFICIGLLKILVVSPLIDLGYRLN
ncbi:YggT family protein [Nitrosomonas sp.]|uniref:YggT family protein n=1 Tax=Nitrosomonas sp. TaxID=42353 RepID=UPI001D3EE288|nr:YggT family protein [Nitrosomonas sp.]MCB1950340.1 YggT family protein [Nitrosomonas sp.]